MDPGSLPNFAKEGQSPTPPEVYLKIDGHLVYLWRAVDAEGEVRKMQGFKSAGAPDSDDAAPDLP